MPKQALIGFPLIDRELAQYMRKTNIRAWAFQVTYWEKKCQFRAFKESEAIQMESRMAGRAERRPGLITDGHGAGDRVQIACMPGL
jgi:hypothetical protein